MNKKYIDFVPSKRSSVKAVTTQRTVSRQPAPSVNKTPVTATAKLSTTKMVTKKAPTSRVATAKTEAPSRRNVPRRPVVEPAMLDGREVEFGVIEDLGPVRDIEAINVEPKQKLAKAPTESQTKSQSKTQGKTFNIPRTPFINQEKVIKRPLSKNVYAKRVVVPKEEPKGPITIITKPEKDAHVSLIVAVILTIILGAAAGTVAFLLLPK